MNRAVRIGLTGGIGSGKTTVSDMFRALGIPVIDADQIAREIVEPGREAYYEILDLFGDRVLAEDRRLKRDIIREIIFGDQNMKKALEDIMHPRILREIDEKAALCPSPYCILSIPLLLESGPGSIVDRILVIDVPEEEQIKRTTRRDGISREQACSILRSQINREKRLEAADDIIDNSGDMKETKAQVDKLNKKYLKLAPISGSGNQIHI